MRETFFSGLKNILWNIGNWFVSVVELPWNIHLGYVIGALIAGILLLASAAWAGNIAENKGRAPHLHFFLGLLFPFIYPAIICFTLRALEGSPLMIKQNQKNKSELAVALRTAQIEAAEKAAAEQLEREEADPTLWSKERMERVAYKADGSAAGPFTCTLADGKQIRVLTVREIQAEVVVFELEGNTPGAAGPIMRFPYSRIHGMVLENQA